MGVILIPQLIKMPFRGKVVWVCVGVMEPLRLQLGAHQQFSIDPMGNHALFDTSTAIRTT